ncbi:hypothetical protein, partial [Paenibacillus elgii]
MEILELVWWSTRLKIKLFVAIVFFIELIYTEIISRRYNLAGQYFEYSTSKSYMEVVMEKRIISFLLCFMLMITYGSPTMAANGDTKYQYDTRGQLVEVSNSNGTIYHDYDVNGNRIRKHSTGNLLINSSFETYTGTNGIADGWTRYGAAGDFKVVTTPVVSGSRAQQISVEGLGGVYQEVAVTGNSTYEIKGRVNITALSSGKVQLVVQYYDAAGNLLSDVRPAETG